MEMLLEKLSPGQIVAVVSIVCGMVVALAMIVGITKYQFQSLADDTALKRERQQAEMAIRQKAVERGAAAGVSLEMLLSPESMVPDEDRERLNAELAKRFGLLDCSGGEIEEALARAMGSDPARKGAIIGVMDELLENDAPHPAILAAVRPLCGTPPKVPVPTPGA